MIYDNSKTVCTNRSVERLRQHRTMPRVIEPCVDAAVQDGEFACRAYVGRLKNQADLDRLLANDSRPDEVVA